MNVNELRARKAKLLEECRSLLDSASGGKLGSASSMTYDKNIAEVDGLNETIKRAEKLETEQNSISGVGQRQVSDRITGFSDPQDRDPQKNFRSMGDFYTSVVNAGTPNAQMDKRLEAVRAESRAITGMGGAVPSDGGFLIPEAWSTDLMALTYKTAQVTSKTTQLSLGAGVESINLPTLIETSRADGSRMGGVQAYWKSEGTQLTGVKPALGNVKLSLEMLTGLTYFTDRLNKFSAIGLEQFLNPLFAAEFAFKLDDGLIEGTGAGQPLGIMNSPALITVAKEAAQLGKTIVTENILNMYARLPAECRANAAWFINQDVEPQLYAMSLALGTAGIATFMPAYGLSGKPYATLMGLPIIPIEQCSTLGSVGDIILADMSKYYYAYNGDGITGATSIHIRFDYGETAMRWEFFADGQPGVLSPVTPFKGTATQSPFVTLAVRA